MYERYCNLRDSLHLTDAEIARKCDFSKSTLSDWKSGKCKPNAEKLLLISKELNTTIEYLMTGEKTNFTLEHANLDVQLSNQEKRLKEYMLKFAKLSDEKRNQIMSLIDMLEDK